MCDENNYNRDSLYGLFFSDIEVSVYEEILNQVQD